MTKSSSWTAMKKGHGSILKNFFLFSSMKSWTKRKEWNFQWMGGRETPKQEKLGTGLSIASESKARVWVAHIQKRVVLLNFFGRRSTDRWGKMLGVAILDLVVEAQWWLHSSPNGSTHERRYQSIQLKQPGPDPIKVFQPKVTLDFATPKFLTWNFLTKILA